MTLDHAWDILATMTLQGGVVCLSAGAGLLLLRKAAAASRHLLLALTASALLAAPLLGLFLPHWQVSLDAGASTSSRYAAERTAMQAREAAPLSGAGAHLLRPEAPAPTTSVTGTPLPTPLHEAVSARSAQGPTPAAVASVAEVRRAPTPVWQTARCRQTVLAVWLFGSGIVLLRLLAGLIGTRRVTARETVFDPALSRAVRQLQSELGMERAVTVRQTLTGSALPVPLTWGCFRPTLLLPPTFSEWPKERRRMVLLHELAHIQRADWLVQLLIQITRALYWFHPLVWWTTGRLQAESERACDDTVLLTGVAPAAYAETLLEVLRTMNRSKTSALSTTSMLSMAHPPIEARLRAILSPQRRQRPSRSITLLAFVGMVVAAAALPSVQVGAGQTPASPHVLPAPAIVSQRELNATTLRPLPGGQSRAEKSSTKSRKSHSADEAAMLRKKLDALEQMLIQNQQENVRLRQQVKALEMQKRRNAVLSQKPPTVSEDQFVAAQTMLRDLQQQQALLRTRAERAAELYRNGVMTQEEVRKSKAEENANRMRIEAAETQLQALKAGNRTTGKEQAMVQIRQEIAIKQAELAAAQESLKITQERYKAGTISGGELSDEEVKVGRLRAEIDKLKVELSQEPGR